jgi:hypothetical protein
MKGALPDDSYLTKNGYLYRKSEIKSRSSLAKLMFRLPFSLLLTSSKHSQTFYGCLPFTEKLQDDYKNLKNTRFIGMEYETFCDGKIKKKKKLNCNKRTIQNKKKLFVKNNGNYKAFTLYTIFN